MRIIDLENFFYYHEKDSKKIVKIIRNHIDKEIYEKVTKQKDLHKLTWSLDNRLILNVNSSIEFLKINEIELIKKLLLEQENVNSKEFVFLQGKDDKLCIIELGGIFR